MDVVGFKTGPLFSGGGADEVEHPSQAPPLLLRRSSLRQDYRNGSWEFFSLMRLSNISTVLLFTYLL